MLLRDWREGQFPPHSHTYHCCCCCHARLEKHTAENTAQEDYKMTSARGFKRTCVNVYADTALFGSAAALHTTTSATTQTLGHKTGAFLLQFQRNQLHHIV